MRKIKCYLVYEGTKEDVSSGKEKALLTVVLHFKQTQEYILNKIILDHAPHYVSWCELNNKNKNSLDTRLDYALNILNLKEEKQKYSVIKMRYPLPVIMIMLRLLNRCVPIGCSFDSKVEINALQKTLEEAKKSNSSIDSKK